MRNSVLGIFFINVLWLCLIWCCTSCIGPKLDQLDFVEVITNIPELKGVGRVILSGTVNRTLLDVDSLEEHGFIIAENWTGTADDLTQEKPGVKKVNLGKIHQGGFTHKLNNLNAERTIYSIKAYAIAGGPPIYGSLERFSFNFAVDTDTVSINNNEATLTAFLYGLEAFGDSIIDHGHIIARDTANLYLNKPFFKIWQFFFKLLLHW